MSRVLGRIRALHFGLTATFSLGFWPAISDCEPELVNTFALKCDRSGIADLPGRRLPRGDGKHDDAKRKHRKSHEFKHQGVHGNPPDKPVDL
jgi:hypothetical protein